MAIQREIWQDYIIKNLFKNNEFLKRSSDAGANVLSGKVVHIPQAGGLPNVEKNRSSLPASVTQRTDTEVTYNLDNYSTDPILITNAEQIELSYNKMDSVMKEHMSTLNQRIADEMLVKWSPSSASSIIRTTGDSVATHLTDTTGNRKRLTVADIRNAAKVLDKMDMPTQGRVMVMSADMYSQFMDELTATDKRDFSSTIDPATGRIGRFWNFDIYMRSEVVSFTNAATPVVKAYADPVVATDNDAVLCWCEEVVERAVGEINAFEQVKSPVYYGNIYSFEVRMGGRIRRSDEKGIVAIVQAAGDGN